MEMIHTHGLANTAETKQELRETLEKWNGLFKKRITLEETEAMKVGHQ